MSDLEQAITGYFPQIYAGVYQGYRVILRAMLTEIYIEAVLVDEDLADQVRELWDHGLISDQLAVWAWWLMFSHSMTAFTISGHSNAT